MITTTGDRVTEVSFPWCEVELVQLLLRPLNGLLYQPQIKNMNNYEHGAVDGMLGRGNRSTWRKHPQMSLCPQITHYLIWLSAAQSQ
jgi:hypothetical protein